MTGGPSPVRLASAGIGVVGASFGMARYGYGLLLPDIRSSYGLTSGALGVIAAGSYLAYLAASAAVGPLAARLGARRLVVLGGCLATTGMLLAGLSGTPLVLAVGVLVGGASCGLVFPPFSDAVKALVAPARQARTLAAISAGTGYGVAIAVPIALVAGSAWRSAWLAFAAVAMLATLWAARVLPRAVTRPTPRDLPRISWSWLVCPRSGPLLVGALLLGLAASVYWTFAVDYLVTEGSLSASTSRLFLALVGAASVLGVLAGDLLGRVSPAGAFSALTAMLGGAFGLLAAAPASVGAAALSGVLFGASFNLVVAIQCIWTSRVFAQRPSTGLAALMFMLGLGLLIGPLAAGLLADRFGLGAVLLIAAALAAIVGLLPPREPLVRAGRHDRGLG
jgi:predicted MFS family arabinose efflux permease